MVSVRGKNGNARARKLKGFWNQTEEVDKMEEVIQILMRRDDLTREEAIDEIKNFKQEAKSLMEDGRFWEVEDLLIDYLGLEPDYLMALMF